MRPAGMGLCGAAARPNGRQGEGESGRAGDKGTRREGDKEIGGREGWDLPFSLSPYLPIGRGEGGWYGAVRCSLTPRAEYPE